jgi:hypothetical protein
MDFTKDIVDTVGFYQKAFTLILALALAEAFKQFVADKADKEEDRVIHWDRLWSLISFLFLIFPFFQGTSRYFYVRYLHDPKLLSDYAASIMFDGVMFTIEAALFFVMSRTLSPTLWRRFYYSVLWLFVIDSIWAFFSWQLYAVDILSWLLLNLVATAVLGAFIVVNKCVRPGCTPSMACMICCIGIIFRTILDYSMMWSFYFPSAPA